MNKSRAEFDRNFRFITNEESKTEGCGNCVFDSCTSNKLGCLHPNVGMCGLHARIEDGGTECNGGFWVARNGPARRGAGPLSSQERNKVTKKPPTPRESMPRMQVATVRLLPNTIKRIDAQAIRLGITANKIKREAIEEKLAKLERSAR